MANQLSLSKKQAKALKRLLEHSVGESVDLLVKEYGQDAAFTLYALKQRLEKMDLED